jgi:AcrR family transcriptional regulator
MSTAGKDVVVDDERAGVPDRVLPGGGMTVAERMAVEAAVPPLKPRVREIVDVARDILDEEGLAGISMRAIAARLGVRAPSLYKHLADKQAILDVLVADILRENGAVLRAAIVGAEDPVEAVIGGFRTWALGNPNRYEALMMGPLDDSPLVRSAALYSGDPLRWVMQDDLEGAVTLWAFAHGLVELERTRRIPPVWDPDLVWAWGAARLRHPDDPDPRGLPDIAEMEERGTAARSTPTEPVELSPRAQRIVEVARRILDEQGPEAMSMRTIAAELGVRAPSLYKHLPDKAALEDAIKASILNEMADIAGPAVVDAFAAGEDALAVLFGVYRDYALAHPNLYRLNMGGPLDDGPLVRWAEQRTAWPVYEASGRVGIAGLAVWAFIHGMVDLELKDRLPPGYDMDAIRARGIDALRAVPAPTPDEDR